VAHRGDAPGPEQGHVAQHRIVEDHIGRQAGLLGDLAALGAQRLEQRIADGIGGARLAAAPPTLALGREHQRHRGAALQDRARLGPESQPAMIIGTQRVAQQQRAGDRLDQRRLLAVDDAEDGEALVPIRQAALARLTQQ
ncbi:hypothetical protein QU38_01125, partial [Staphylococcus aureus]